MAAPVAATPPPPGATAADPAAGWRRVVLMLAVALVFFGAVAAINWAANPYGAWRVALFDGVYRTDSPGERVATPYRLRSEAAHTVLLGSSRVLFGIAIPQGGRDGVLNAALSGAYLDELLAEANVLTENHHVRRVFWGVDPHLLDARCATFRDPLIPTRLARAWRPLIGETLLNTDALYASGRLALRAIRGRSRLPMEEGAVLPWSPSTIAEALAGVTPAGLASATDATIRSSLIESVEPYSTFAVDEASMRRFRQGVDRLRAAGIDVQLFIPPLSVYELEGIRQAGRWEQLQEWKRRLLEVGPYWDYSGYGELASREDLFLDVLHVKPALGHLILRQLLGLDCEQCAVPARSLWRARVWVDRDTMAAHLQAQDSARQAFVEQGSRASERVAGILASSDRPSEGGADAESARVVAAPP